MPDDDGGGGLNMGPWWRESVVVVGFGGDMWEWWWLIIPPRECCCCWPWAMTEDIDTPMSCERRWDPSRFSVGYNTARLVLGEFMVPVKDHPIARAS